MKTSELTEILDKWCWLKLNSWKTFREAKLLVLPTVQELTPETFLMFKVEMTQSEIKKYFDENPTEKRDANSSYFQNYLVMFGTISALRVDKWDKVKKEEYFEYLIKQ